MDKNFRINICGETIQNQSRIVQSTSSLDAIQTSYAMCQPEWWMGPWQRKPEIMQRDILDIDKQIIGTILIEELEKGNIDTITITITAQPEGVYTVTCKEIPALITEGDNIHEALENTKDAYDTVMEAQEYLKERIANHEKD